jgi:hypothetical protein
MAYSRMTAVASTESFVTSTGSFVATRAGNLHHPGMRLKTSSSWTDVGPWRHWRVQPEEVPRLPVAATRGGLASPVEASGHRPRASTALRPMHSRRRDFVHARWSVLDRWGRGPVHRRIWSLRRPTVRCRPVPEEPPGLETKGSSCRAPVIALTCSTTSVITFGLTIAPPLDNCANRPESQERHDFHRIHPL